MTVGWTWRLDGIISSVTMIMQTKNHTFPPPTRRQARQHNGLNTCGHPRGLRIDLSFLLWTHSTNPKARPFRTLLLSIVWEFLLLFENPVPPSGLILSLYTSVNTRSKIHDSGRCGNGRWRYKRVAIDHASGTTVSPNCWGNCGCNYTATDEADFVWSKQPVTNETQEGREEVHNSRERRLWRRRRQMKRKISAMKGNSPSKMESFPSSVASLLALLSSPADSAFFIHPCSFPSDYPFINLCAVAIAEQRAKVKRERWTRKIFAVGEAKARTRE